MPASDLEPPFDHGVASFDPTADSVVLWTRAPGVARVRWCVARRPARGGAEAGGRRPGGVGRGRGARRGRPLRGGHRRRARRRRPATATGSRPARRARRWAAPARCRPRGTDARAHRRRLLRRLVARPLHRLPGARRRRRRPGPARRRLHLRDPGQGQRPRPRARPRGRVARRLPGRATRQCRSDADLARPAPAPPDGHHVGRPRRRRQRLPRRRQAPRPQRARALAGAAAGRGDRPAGVAARPPARSRPTRCTLYRSFAVGDLAEIVLLDTRIIGRDVQPDDDGTLPYDDPRRSMLGDDAAGVGPRAGARHHPALVPARHRRRAQPHGAAGRARRHTSATWHRRATR